MTVLDEVGGYLAYSRYYAFAEAARQHADVSDVPGIWVAIAEACTHLSLSESRAFPPRAAGAIIPAE